MEFMSNSRYSKRMMDKYQIDKGNISSREEKILKFWEEQRIFERSVEQRKECQYFTFYDGPPFATGLPHYGHLLAGTIKDVIPRYKTMKGYYVPRRFGWDCHGLPVENEIEKQYSLTGAKAIEEFGIPQFNEACRAIVLRYTEEWKSTVTRMGRWVDFASTYKTMDLSFMESVWWVFKQLWEKGLVYQGYKVMPFSTKLGTPLSNFEAGENYQEVDDPAITVEFQSAEDPHLFFLAWTTTPWTLVSNLALMVGPDIDYVQVASQGKKFILAESRLGETFKSPDEYTLEKRFKGKELAGKNYRPLFPYFASHEGFRVIVEEGVSLDEGTGIVHSAPGFGELDFYACKREHIPVVCPVDINGQFTEEIPEYQGILVKDADKAIIKRLREEGKLFKQGVVRHRYPFCWRSDTPLIYRAVSTWFVAVERFREAMVQANLKVHWTPEHIKEGRFGKWLEGARDWAISRNRYWGTPIPIWQSPSGKHKVIGSIRELEELTKTKVSDLHRHHIDQLSFAWEGETYTRIPEVFDCWFESGSMPYAQLHYPFENSEYFANHFPADFIGEGVDQTRGWFYTLMILSTALFNEPAFKNVIVNGIILAEDGTKMSKRLRNYPDPMEVTHKYGADAIRLYMLSSPAVRADDLCFSQHGVELVLRQVLIPFWNSYVFFATYANIYGFDPDKEFAAQPEALIDRWILSLLNGLVLDVERGMDHYNLQMAVQPLVNFIDCLTNWYIRRSRRRFWSDEATPDRLEAFSTLYQVLVKLCQVAAPFIPFLTEEIYRNLKGDSVHLSTYPQYRASQRDQDLEESMQAVLETVSLGHALRKENKLKVRQPLQQAFIASKNKHLLSLLESKQHLIQDELNVKQIVFSEDESSLVHLKPKPNFRTLGKRFGAKMPQVQQLIVALDQKALAQALSGQAIAIALDGELLTFSPDEIHVEREVKQGAIAQNFGEITIALNPELNEDLILEGIAREIVNKVNTLRKEHQFNVTDRIQLKMHTTPKVEQAIHLYRDSIAQEILATRIVFEPNEGESIDLNGEMAQISIKLN